MTIRPDSLSDADYAARVFIGNTCFPDYVDTVEELRFSDAHRDPKIKWARFIVEVDDPPVATGVADLCCRPHRRIPAETVGAGAHDRRSPWRTGTRRSDPRR